MAMRTDVAMSAGPSMEVGYRLELLTDGGVRLLFEQFGGPIDGAKVAVELSPATVNEFARDINALRRQWKKILAERPMPGQVEMDIDTDTGGGGDDEREG